MPNKGTMTAYFKALRDVIMTYKDYWRDRRDFALDRRVESTQ